jgi:hypothetical protein
VIPSALTIAWSLASSLTFLAMLAGIAVWLIIRRREIRVWLPTLRVLPRDSRRMPRWSLLRPPLLPFLCFILASASLLFFATRPSLPIQVPLAGEQPRVHVLVDFSPSVASLVSARELRQRVTDVASDLPKGTILTLGTTHSGSIHRPTSLADLKALLEGQDFHRAGARLARTLQRQLAELGEIDRVLVVSDRDAHSWAGFHWSNLPGNADLEWVDVSPPHAAHESRANVYINDARHIPRNSGAAAERADRSDWELEIVRTATGSAIEGRLSVALADTTLEETSWRMSENDNRAVIEVSWLNTKAASALSRQSVSAGGDTPLVWTIEISDRRANHLASDDLWRSPLTGMRREALIIAEPWGEHPLDDPARELAASLSALGFDSRRVDRVTELTPPWNHFPLAILIGGIGRGTDWFCPQTSSANSPRRAHTRLWIVPQHHEPDWEELCLCLARMRGAHSSTQEKLRCEAISSREDYISRLELSRARQIGGLLGSSETAPAFSIPSDGATEVTAFTVPLLPLVETGLTHTQIPLLLKEILRWQALWHPGADNQIPWLRAADILDALDSPPEAPRAALSNVPSAESLLTTLDASAMPPEWGASHSARGSKTLRQDDSDPLPWLRLALGFILAASFIEGIYLLTPVWLSRRRTGAILLPLALLSFPATSNAQMTLLLDSASYSPPSFSFQDLSRETAARTSIELSPSPTLISLAALDTKNTFAPTEAWLWTRSLKSLLTPQGRLKPAVVAWLARGGFLVIEESLPENALTKATERWYHHPATPASWGALPPDHEFMRSFYLLDALPTCQGTRSWQGFQFDGRLAILVIPFSFLDLLRDHAPPSRLCAQGPDRERSLRLFVNLLMVVLATDYKRDQIHLPEILKRLR